MPKCKECEREVLPEDFDEETETCYECLFYMDEAARENQRQTVATESLEDSPWQTGERRGAVIPSTR